MSPNPVLVEIRRGPLPEAWLRGAYAVVRDGELVDGAGDPAQRSCLRSVAKPFQALAHVLSGAADRFGVDTEGLALLCASHGGEPRHVATAAALLARGGLTVAALRCGPHPPLHGDSAARLRLAGDAPTPLHNNCSGKHAGMLLAALHRGEDLETYLHPEHPHQRRIADVLGALAEAPAEGFPRAVDGCSAPTFYPTLTEAGRAFSRFAALARDGGGALGAASRRVFASVGTDPFMIGGTDRFDTDVATVTRGRVLTKIGAEGFYGAAVPALGLGIALHVDDGSWNGSERLVAALLHRHGALDEDDLARLAPYTDPIRRNHTGRPIGEIHLTLPLT